MVEKSERMKPLLGNGFVFHGEDLRVNLRLVIMNLKFPDSDLAGHSARTLPLCLPFFAC